MGKVELRRYRTSEGVVPLDEWLGSLRDRIVRARIGARIQRLELGLRGDWRSVGGGVSELKLDAGPGYRVYFAESGKAVIVLLCGGNKSSQSRDIEAAHAYWKDYKTRCRQPAL